jgi:hypothetical protein
MAFVLLLAGDMEENPRSIVTRHAPIVAAGSDIKPLGDTFQSQRSAGYAPALTRSPF